MPIKYLLSVDLNPDEYRLSKNYVHEVYMLHCLCATLYIDWWFARLCNSATG